MRLRHGVCQQLQTISFVSPDIFCVVRNPTHGSREVTVHCDEPAKLVVNAEPRDDSIAYEANPKSGRVNAAIANK